MVSNVNSQDNNEVGVDVTFQVNEQQARAARKTLADVKRDLGEGFAPDNATIRAARERFKTYRTELEQTRRAARDVDDVYRSWGKALDEVNRRGYIDTLTGDLQAAIRSGKDLEQVMELVKKQLDAIGASESEVRRVVQAAADAAKQVDAERIAAVQQAALLGQQQATGRRGAALQTLGREARIALPAVGIPGTRISTESLARLVEVSGRLNLNLKELAIGGGVTVAAIGAVAVAFDLFVKQSVEPAAKLLREIAGARIETAGLLAVASEQEIVDQRQKLLDDLTRLEAERNQAILDAANQISTARESNNPIQEVVAGFGLLFSGQGPIGEARQRVSELDAQLASANIQLDELNKVYEENQRRVQASTDAQIQLQAELSTRTLSAEATRKQIEEIKYQIDAQQKLLDSGVLTEEAFDRMTASTHELAIQMGILEDSLPEKERMEAAAQVFTNLIEGLRKGIEGAKADAERIADETASATRDFNTNLTDLIKETNQERLDLEADYGQKVTDIANKYADDLDKIGVTLSRRLEDLGRKAERDINQATFKAQFERLQEQIKFNNTTAKQARDLARELEGITAESSDRRAELIRQRDFGALRDLNRQRDRDLDKAIDNYNVEQREREIAFAEQQQLTNNQLEFEAQTRRIRFEQEIEDARIANTRQSDDLKKARDQQERLLRESYDRDLSALGQATNQKLTLLYQGYSKELTLAAQTSAQRVAIAEQERAALLAQARAFQFVGGLLGVGGNSNSISFQNTQNFQVGTPSQLGNLASVIAGEVRRQLLPFVS